MKKRESKSPSRSTKRALTSSVLALVLCFVMLLGTTFAWFTDTASTGVNTIQAGTLDVELLDKDGKSLEGKTLAWQKAEGHENEEVLWEPGATYRLEPVYIKNNGNLALKYKVVISGIEGDAKLNEAIDWTMKTNGKAVVQAEDEPEGSEGVSVQAEEAETVAYAKLAGEYYLLPDEEATLTISGTMKTTAGNEYQGLSIDGVAIAVLATQYTHEYDSTNNQYDRDATYGAEVVTEDELKNVLKVSEWKDASGKLEITLDKDYYLTGAWEPIDAWIGNAGREIVINGNGHTIYNMTVNGGEKVGFIGSFSGGKLTIQNLNFDGASVTTSASFAGVVIGYQYSDVTLDNVNVTNSTVATTAAMGIRIGGLVGSSMRNDKTGGVKLALTNCSVEDCTFVGYHNTCGLVGTLFNYKTDMDGVSVSGCEVNNCTFYWGSTKEEYNNYAFVDGALYSNKYGVLPDGVTGTGNTAITGVTTVSTAADLATALAKGGTIVLTSDINMNNAWTTAVLRNENLTLDGNGHTITKLNAPLINFYGGTCTVNNLTVANSAVVDNTDDCLGSGVILNQAQWANLYMNNCHVKNTTLTVGRDTRSGALVGYWIGGGEIKNCTVNNVEITNQAGTVGGIVGNRQEQSGYESEAKITSCSVANSKFATNDSDWRVGTVIGTVNAGTTTLTDCTSSGNTLKQDNVTDPGHELYGRTASGTITVN